MWAHVCVQFISANCELLYGGIQTEKGDYYILWNVTVKGSVSLKEYTTVHVLISTWNIPAVVCHIQGQSSTSFGHFTL